MSVCFCFLFLFLFFFFTEKKLCYECLYLVMGVLIVEFKCGEFQYSECCFCNKKIVI